MLCPICGNELRWNGNLGYFFCNCKFPDCVIVRETPYIDPETALTDDEKEYVGDLFLRGMPARDAVKKVMDRRQAKQPWPEGASCLTCLTACVYRGKQSTPCWQWFGPAQQPSPPCPCGKDHQMLWVKSQRLWQCPEHSRIWASSGYKRKSVPPQADWEPSASETDPDPHN